MQPSYSLPRGWRAAALAVAGALATLFSGCAVPSEFDSARVGPFFTPANTLGEPSLGGMRRVVVLPIWSGDVAPPEAAAELDPAIVTALQREHRFEVVTLPREESRRRFRAEAMSSTGALPPELMAALKREYAADAVLFIDLTVYKPYRPLAIGFRAKLATIDAPRLVWTFDDVFSTEDAAVANSARNFFLGADRRGVPADLTPAVLQSPGKFASYAAAAMFSTLPPVIAPVTVVAPANTD